MKWIALAGIVVLLAGTPALLPRREAPERAHPIALIPLHAPDASGDTDSGIGRREGSRVWSLTGPLAWAGPPSASFDGAWIVFAGRETVHSAAGIYRVAVDGSGLRRITTGTGDPAEPIVMPGDEILFSDRAPDAPPARALYACAQDGGALRRLTRGPHWDHSPALLDDGRVRFVRTLLSGPRAGESLLLTIHPDGTNLSAALPAPVPAARVMDGFEPGSLVRASIGSSRDADPWIVSPRPEPPRLTSVVNEARATGMLLCLDVRASRFPAIAALPAGRVARVQAFQVEAEGPGRGRIVAEAPVYPDGSFLLEAPADTLLGLVLRDRDGVELASLESGVWVRPNESRGCVGCHAPDDRAPANRRPMAIDSTGWRSGGAGR